MPALGLSFGDKGDILIPVKVAGKMSASLGLLSGMNRAAVLVQKSEMIVMIKNY